MLLLLQLTVYESLIFSARLRFNKDVEINTVYAFVQEVMELVELEPLSDSLVGAPGVTGLSVEQRKRLTIAVELVANPSIVFMDEPTSGEHSCSASRESSAMLSSNLQFICMLYFNASVSCWCCMAAAM